MSDLATNLAKAEAFLARFRTDGVHNHIGGKAMPAVDGTTFAIISPVDLKPLAQVAHGKAADVALAAAAKAAFPAWRAMDGVARKELLHKIADAIEARAEEIAFVEAMDTGQAIRFIAKAALLGAENFRYFADLAPMAKPCARRARRWLLHQRHAVYRGQQPDAHCPRKIWPRANRHPFQRRGGRAAHRQ